MTAIRVTPRPGLFPIGDYPNTTSGDDATGIRAAVAACVSAGGGVVQLENPRGGYNLNTPDPVYGTNGPCIVNGDNRGFPIEIRGRGKGGVTTLNYGAHVSTLVGAKFQSAHPILSPISLYDMTVNGAAANTATQGYIYHYAVAATDANEFETTGVHYLERVDAVTFGHSTGGSSIRFAVKWNIIRDGLANAAAAPTGYLRGLHVKDCDWGHGAGSSTSRGGGQGGVVVTGFVNGTNDGSKDSSGRFKPSKLYGQVYNPPNVIVDDIIVDGLKHTSGKSPVDQSAPGAPIQIGGDGIIRTVRVSGCYIENSGDIAVELDGCMSGIVENSTFYNGDGNQILVLPFGTGGASPGSDEWDITIRDCEVVYPDVDNYAGANFGTPNGGAFASNSRFGCFFDGRVLWENINVRYHSVADAATTLCTLGPARDQTVRNCTLEMLGTQTTGTVNFVKLFASGRPQTLRIENLRCLRNTPIDTVSTTDTVVTGQIMNDLNLQIKGFSYSSRGAQTNSGKRAVRMLDTSGAGAGVSDTWSTDLMDTSLLYETGASTNYTYDGTSPKTYSAALNLTTANQAIYVATNGVSTADNLVGRVKDGATYMLLKTGASLTGYKHGMFCARRDSTTRIEGYVYDDGTNSYLCLDKIVSGTRTSLLLNYGAVGSTVTSGAVVGGNLATDTITAVSGVVSAVGLQLPSRLSTSTTYYFRIIIQGDVVTAEHWASAVPGTSTATPPAGTGDAWCAVTLLTTDIQVFGSRAVGEQGFVQIPIDTGAKIGTISHQRLHVVSGRIEGVHISSLDAAAGNPIGIYHQPAFASKVRIDGQLELVSSDFRNLKNATGTVLDTSFLAGTEAFQQLLLRHHNQWVTPLADTAVTFASGTAWQNQTGMRGTLVVQGGTVTKIELSKDGTTYRDTGVIAGAIPVRPNWYVKLTLTVAPTAYFMAED